jgi:23S rRNA pseudouridine1911/1915/1917 synthase
MSEALHLVADKDHERLDSFLARTLPGRSRSFWQKQCEAGRVSIGGQEHADNYRLKLGETVTVLLLEQPDFSQQSLPIVYEDDDVLVINKPAGILTHAKGVISDEFTVAEFVRPRTTDGVDTNRPGIVHRLDRGTSGMLIAARTPEAKRWLQKQFAQHKVKKMYIALIHGHLKEPTAMLRLPIERNARRPQTFHVGVNGKHAETVYEITQAFANYTLVKLRPLSGRTHQLRVHMAYLGHPIAGDELYGTADKRLGRLFLHAAELEITLPSRERKLFTTPLPPELQDYLKTLQ